MNHKKIKLAICVPVHGRHELVRKTLAALVRHSEYYFADFTIKVFVAGAAPEIKRFCAANNIEFVFTENTPLGRKFNRLVEAGARWGDYIVVLGSDAFLAPDYFQIAAKYIHKGVQAMAPDAVIFVDGATLDARFVRSEPLGSGLCFSRELYLKVIETHSGLYRSELNKGLDSAAFHRLCEAGDGRIVPMTGFHPIIIEVKTEDNIWKFSQFESHPKAYMDEFEHYFTRHDIGAIKNFHVIYTYTPEK